MESYVWCGILDCHIIGPYFFYGNVTAITYLNMLQNELLEMLEAVNLDTIQRMWIQQDGVITFCAHHNKLFECNI